MLLDPEDEQRDEMRKQGIVEQAVRLADGVILEQGISADEMLDLTYKVGMQMMEKVGFQLQVERMRKKLTL